MKETIKIQYKGKPRKMYIIKRAKHLKLNDGDIFEVTKEELVELKKSRIAYCFKEVKGSKKETEVEDNGKS